MHLTSNSELAVLRTALENDLLAFTRYFFKEILGFRMKVAPHHVLLCKTLEKVHAGEIKRLVINMPPGYTKTELAVVHFCAWAFAKNLRCRFIHATYSDKLALENSAKIRDIIESERFQELWPCKLRTDTKAKGAWKNEQGGTMQARAAGGPITGFRAGQPTEEGETDETAKFSGAFIIDDPLKPDDASSITMVDTINSRFTKVFKSRLMVARKDPMILIMQRISDNDPSAYVLNGGTGEEWHHLNLPVIIDKTAKQKKYKKSKPIPHDLPDGALWEYKHTLPELAIEKNADSFTFAAQYMQDPVPLGGAMFKEPWIKYYTRGSVAFEYTFITADTAQKTKEKNDYSVFACWGVKEGKLYLIDLIRGKWEAPELLKRARLFWIKHWNPSSTVGRLRHMLIEDKSSGTGLIQTLKNDSSPVIPVKAIQRNIDKVTRAMDGAPYVESGRVFLPSDAEFTLDFVTELLQFTAALTHRHDDQVDVLLDAIVESMGATKKIARGISIL